MLLSRGTVTAEMLDVIDASLAVIAIVPALPAKALATPRPFTLTSAPFVDSQFTEVVRFLVVPLLYVPVAVYCAVAPTARVICDGVIAIAVSVTVAAAGTARGAAKLGTPISSRHNSEETIHRVLDRQTDTRRLIAFLTAGKRQGGKYRMESGAS